MWIAPMFIAVVMGACERLANGSPGQVLCAKEVRVHENADATFEIVTTRDGARIVVKRRAHEAATPVIFVHGLAVNADLWDIPDVQEPDFKFRSLPSLLHDAGCDIWLMNLRGHGPTGRRSAPPDGQDDWCVDHFVLYDIPAVVEHVAERTGRRPFIVANSMGAMSTAAYLEGATLREENGQIRIVADESEAERRQTKIAGCVLLEFPAALRWQTSIYDPKGRVRWARLFHAHENGESNFLFELLSRAGWLHAVLATVGEVRLDWVRPSPGWEKRMESMPRPLRQFFERSDRIWAEVVAFAADRWKGGVNFSPTMFRRGIRYAADHMKSGVLSQMAKSVRARSFVSALGAPDHDYAEHYGNVRLPVLLVMGGKDNIASADATRTIFFERIGSTDKQILVQPELAHGELEYSAVAAREVYPTIVRWILERATRGEPANRAIVR